MDKNGISYTVQESTPLLTGKSAVPVFIMSDIRLQEADNGIGMPPGFDVRRDGNMGLKIIYLLGENQLQAQPDFFTEHGVTCRFQFKDNLYKPRV